MKITKIFLVGIVITLVLVLQKQPLLTQNTSETIQIQPETQTEPEQQRSTWETILSFLRKQPRQSLLSRDSICPIAPGLVEDEPIIWSDHPIFIWKKADSDESEGLDLLNFRILSPYDPLDPLKEQTVLWEQRINTRAEKNAYGAVEYSAEALESGKRYDWEIKAYSEKEPNLGDNIFKSAFDIMNSEERANISQSLAVLNAELNRTTMSKEDMALEKALFFIKQELWSDALGILHAGTNSSSELSSKIEEISNYLCTEE